ncbi:MAG: sulfite exporter TauE/SafE family protein [Noviherbaspirillum sp.]
MTVLEAPSIPWLFAAAFGASALGGVLGMASGIFIVPILTLLFGVDIHVAIGASIVSVIACSCGSAAPFLKGRLTNIRHAIVLETATTLGALTGVFLIGIASTPFLYGLFAVILAISAKQMLARRREAVDASAADARSWATALRLHSRFTDQALGRDVPYQVSRVPLGLFLMYGAGLVSALLGIGSGVLKIPAMDTALRLPIKVSSATSNFMIGVTAAASAGAYFVRGDIDIDIAGPVALGSVAGAFLGARLLMGIPADKLRIFFVIVLALLAVQMFMSALGTPIPGGPA